MIAAIEHGVLMQTNCSWSIDDSRNKFQFGCEWGRLIENGKLGAGREEPQLPRHLGDLLAQPDGVGDADTLQVMGTPNCGKGEPNQVIRVGHASPACLFADVDVFGRGILMRELFPGDGAGHRRFLAGRRALYRVV